MDPLSNNCKDTLRALTELIIARLKADDIEGAGRGLSWLEFIARDEHSDPPDKFESDEEIYAEALSWLLGLQATIERKTPRGLGTFIANSRRCLTKIGKTGGR